MNRCPFTLPLRLIHLDSLNNPRIYADDLANLAIATRDIRPLVAFYRRDNPHAASLRSHAAQNAAIARGTWLQCGEPYPAATRRRCAVQARAQLIVAGRLAPVSGGRLP